MIKFLFNTICLLSVCCVSSQNQLVQQDSIVDSKYRDDQFYIAFTYNYLHNNIDGLSQQGLSGGAHFGFIRDFPLTKSRRFGLGIGLGFSADSYNHNLLITKQDDDYSFSLLDSNTTPFTKNKLNMHMFEFPLQFRWRTSTQQSYKFWRVYSGFKFSYVFDYVYKHESNTFGSYNLRSLPNFNNFLTHIDLGFGWNTWNFYLSYALTPFFNNDASVNTNRVDLRTINFGLIFYIL